MGKADAFFSKAVLLTEGPTEQGLFPGLGLSFSFQNKNYDLDRIGISVINAGGKNNIKAFVRLLNNFGIPSVAVIDYDSEDKNHETVVKEIKSISPYIYELPRKPGMGDIEGYVCDNIPIQKLIVFLEEVLPPERKAELFSNLKGVIKSVNVEKSNKLRDMRRDNRSLEDVIPILDEVNANYHEVEYMIRMSLANSFRKIKGRTTGRLIGERFSSYFPEEFIKNTLDAVIKLAGFKVDPEGEQEIDEKS
ncbi:conserved hypothetical protein [[Clostridium] ultunense Esp]|nr:conserved hypothetical protein [[Clostridium] ultunense Esp]